MLDTQQWDPNDLGSLFSKAGGRKGRQRERGFIGTALTGLHHPAPAGDGCGDSGREGEGEEGAAIDVDAETAAAAAMEED